MRVCVCGSHACAFFLGWTEWTRGSAGWGVALCDNRTGDDFDLPGRVTHEQQKGGMTLCVQMLFLSNCLIFIFLKKKSSCVM